MMIERKKYLDQLMAKRWNGKVKIITGIRRCGKSFLLSDIYKQALVKEAVKEACARLKDAGAKRALPLAVGGAYHSPLMVPARIELAAAIEKAEFKIPCCPIYQNVDAKPYTDPVEIKKNLLA